VKEREHIKDLGIDGKIIIWILEICDVMVWTGFSWLRIGSSGRSM
jgi:hypothetical protein